MLHTVVISDIHLAEAEPGDGLWMRYRQSRFSPDAEVARMVGELARRIGLAGDQLTLVLNGDIFDLDAPRVIGQESVFHDLPRTADNAIPALDCIFRDNPLFVAAMGSLLADGHTVALVSGNHDVQLTLPQVRAHVRKVFLAAAHDELQRRGTTIPGDLPNRLLFRAWFHKTRCGVVIEHGNQYDPYCAYRYPMAPWTRPSPRGEKGARSRARREIQPTMGSLATRLLVSRMGYFNPHVDNSFMLSVGGYLKHWFRYYAFTRRSLALAWAGGAVRLLVELLRRRDPEDRRRRRANIAACARETKVPVRVVARHARLYVRPAEDRLSLVMRELWVDRVGMGMACALFAALWLFLGPAGFGWIAPLPFVILFAYEMVVPKVPMDEHWRRVARVARKVAKAHQARAVVFGHTHHPEGAWKQSVFYGNTGSWSAAFDDIECTRPISPDRPLVWLKAADATAPLEGGLYAWRDGNFVPTVVREDQRRSDSSGAMDHMAMA
jgi:UDP-2,3-diacylglucosamine pyrophosphatase LpxH